MFHSPGFRVSACSLSKRQNSSYGIRETEKTFCFFSYIPPFIRGKHRFSQSLCNFKLYTSTADASVAQICGIFTPQSRLFTNFSVKTGPTEGLAYPRFKFTVPAPNMNNRRFPAATVYGDNRLCGQGDFQRVRHIKPGARNMQDSIPGFLDALKSPESVVRIGDRLSYGVCAKFYATAVRGYYGNGRGSFPQVNVVILAKGFMLLKFGKTTVSIQGSAFQRGFMSVYSNPGCNQRCGGISA